MTAEYCKSYDIIVVGAGHAGCEAAHAAAAMGLSVLMMTMTVDAVAQMSCNPSIGGVAKGHLCKEVDALGGLMARVADESAIQYRRLNTSKGPAVLSSRVQCDVAEYRKAMLRRLFARKNLDIVQSEALALVYGEGECKGIIGSGDVLYRASCVVLCTGTFLRGLCHIGEYRFEAGRAGDKASIDLVGDMTKLGIRLMRLKTGTPPRLDGRTLDYSAFELQPGDENPKRLSFFEDGPMLPQLPCHMTATGARTHEIIREAFHRSPMFNGIIEGIGARYCPSIEDKVFRFPDKTQHHVFIEPMGLHTREVYPSGISSSLPFDVQQELIHSIRGFENAHIIRPAYAIEYDALCAGQLTHSLELRDFPWIFVAGQLNGTSGYEEAAAQGLMAGINAALKIKKQPPFVLKRSEAYIGVMIDDLVMKGVDEPYRMFTSRAEFRLSLREDNADLRLSEHAYALSLLNDDEIRSVRDKVEAAQRLRSLLKTYHVRDLDRERMKSASLDGGSLEQVLKRPEIRLSDLRAGLDALSEFSEDVCTGVENDVKFEGYIKREEARIRTFDELEAKVIPDNFDYHAVGGLSVEAVTKLKRFNPANLGEAGRIPGITPAAVSALWVKISSMR